MLTNSGLRVPAGARRHLFVLAALWLLEKAVDFWLDRFELVSSPGGVVAGATLTSDGFVARYPTVRDVDGLPPGAGAFLPCSFWLADNLALQGRDDEACALFERLLAVRRAPRRGVQPADARMLGNFPQAMSHMALINTAANLTKARGPAQDRKES